MGRAETARNVRWNGPRPRQLHFVVLGAHQHGERDRSIVRPIERRSRRKRDAIVEAVARVVGGFHQGRSRFAASHRTVSS